MLKELLLRIAGMSLAMLAAEAVLPERGVKKSAMRALAVMETLVIAEPIILAVFGRR